MEGRKSEFPKHYLSRRSVKQNGWLRACPNTVVERFFFFPSAAVLSLASRLRGRSPICLCRFPSLPFLWRGPRGKSTEIPRMLATLALAVITRPCMTQIEHIPARPWQLFRGYQNRSPPFHVCAVINRACTKHYKSTFKQPQLAGLKLWMVLDDDND
jgi:hypothetical protein